MEEKQSFRAKQTSHVGEFADVIVWCTAIRALLEYSARFSTNQSVRYIVTML